MTANASPLAIDFHGDASLADFMAALEPHGDKQLAIHYGGRMIRSGYHITEVKAGSFATLDCGGNPDRWRETILQIEERASESDRGFMLAGKFRAILAQVTECIALDGAARLTVEIGPSGSPMQVFDAGSLRVEAGRLVFKLEPRSAICKPRHRTMPDSQAACCGTAVQRQRCCA